jgi:hypothetical protein
VLKKKDAEEDGQFYTAIVRPISRRASQFHESGAAQHRQDAPNHHGIGIHAPRDKLGCQRLWMLGCQQTQHMNRYRETTVYHTSNGNNLRYDCKPVKPSPSGDSR